MTEQGTDMETQAEPTPEAQPESTSGGAETVDEPGDALVPAGDSALPAPLGDQLPATAGSHAHPSPREYVLIAVVLCILTAIEVGLYYLEGDVNDNLLIAALVVLASAKFFLVAAWYMHMKVDAPFFRRIFVVGMVGATVVYGAVLFTFAATVLAS
jgi:caa(3)-type oxidase subunit IV